MFTFRCRKWKNFSEDLFSIRRADDLADSVEGLSQRHGDKFRVNAGPEFFCSLAQAGLGTLKARLMPRVDCGQHRSISGAISAGFGHDQIYETVNSLAGPAGNATGPLCGGCFAAVWGSRRSTLFNARISPSLASSLGFCVMSAIRTITSAVCIARLARSTPSRSTASAVSLRPAVSVIRNGMPRRLASSSIVSRVVPGLALTIARSKPSNRLRRLDFPAFGSPQRTRRTPSRRIRPSFAVASRRWIRPWMISISAKQPFTCVWLDPLVGEVYVSLDVGDRPEEMATDFFDLLSETSGELLFGSS